MGFSVPAGMTIMGFMSLFIRIGRTSLDCPSPILPFRGVEGRMSTDVQSATIPPA